MKGLKRIDIKPCSACGKGIMHNGDIVAYKVTIGQYMVDTREVQKRAGLEMMMGGGTAGASLAQIMGPDNELLAGVSEVSGLLCQPCFLDFNNSLAEIWEKIAKAAANG